MIDRSSKGTAFIQWLDELPADWNSVRLRNLLSDMLAGNWGEAPGESDVDLFCARIADFDWSHLEIVDENIRTVRSYKRVLVNRFALEPGDLLVEKSGGGEKHPVGRCVQYRGEGGAIFSNFAMRLRPNGVVSSEFLCYALAASYFRGHSWKILNQTTGIQNLDVSAFRSSPIPLPKREEQQRIINHLDQKTAEIDTLVEKLSRQVELLERYRRELIAHTVTRGLDPDAPMRDSGIDWIGEVPTTWRLLKISALYDSRSQKVSDKDYPPLSITMNGVVPQLETVAKTNDGDSRKLVRTGDFVINSRSDRRGACGIAPQDGSCSLINIVLTPRESVHNRYFSYLFRSILFADEFYRWGHGIHDDLWTTNWKDMKSIQVPVPHLEDQEAMDNYLDHKMAEINSIVAGINKQIELFRRYRKQVIDSLVTGKVRVGGVA